MKNLLEETKHLIREGRTVGNTTRQVDTAIDLLHQGHGETMYSNHSLLHMINKRLEFTYNHLFGTKVKFSKRMTKEGIVGKLEIKQ